MLTDSEWNETAKAEIVDLTKTNCKFRRRRVEDLIINILPPQEIPAKHYSVGDFL